MTNPETLTPPQLQATFDDFIASIDKYGTFRSGQLDAIGIGRKAVPVTNPNEQLYEFIGTRNRDSDHNLVGVTYKVEDKNTVVLDKLPGRVAEILAEQADDDEAIGPQIPWVDTIRRYTYEVFADCVELTTEQVYGIDDVAMLRVPIFGGMPYVIADEADLPPHEVMAHQTVGGLYVTEHVLVNAPNIPQPKDAFELLLAQNGTEYSPAASAIHEMLAACEYLRP